MVETYKFNGQHITTTQKDNKMDPPPYGMKVAKALHSLKNQNIDFSTKILTDNK
jgi:hypothetical protein